MFRVLKLGLLIEEIINEFKFGSSININFYKNFNENKPCQFSVYFYIA